MMGIKNTLVCIALLVTSVVFANDNVDPGAAKKMTVVRDGSVFKVIYRGIKAGTVKVTIFNSTGIPVFKESIKKLDGFVRPYNFDNLQQGDYTIELEDEGGKIAEKLNYRNAESQKHVTFLRLAEAERKYVLLIANKGNDKISIKIFDKDNQLVYTTSQAISGDYAQMFDLKKLGNSLTLEVSDRNGLAKRIAI